MKIFLAIPFFLCKSLFSQYYARWETKPLEPGISNYLLQDSATGAKWKTIEIVQPKELAGINNYQSSAELQMGHYYRLVSKFIDNSKRYSPVITIVLPVVDAGEDFKFLTSKP